MRNMATRLAIIYLGKICEIAPTVEFFASPLHPCTRMLLSSIPVISDEEEELKAQEDRVEGRDPVAGEHPERLQLPPQVPGADGDLPPGGPGDGRARPEASRSVPPVLTKAFASYSQGM